MNRASGRIRGIAEAPLPGSEKLLAVAGWFLLGILPTSAQAQTAALPVYTTVSMSSALDTPELIPLGPASGIYAIDTLTNRSFVQAAFPAGATVMYDIEHASATPDSEWMNPRLSEQAFVTLAHARGYEAMLAPAPTVISYAASGCKKRSSESVWHAYLRCLASVGSDGFLAQTQSYQCNTANWLKRLRQVISWHKGPVIAELSAMRPSSWSGGRCLDGESGVQLANDDLAAAPYAQVAVWGYATSATPPHRSAADEVAIVEDMLANLNK